MGEQLDREGIDAIEVSGKCWFAHGKEERLCYLSAAKALGERIHADVILTGGVRDREDLKKGMEAGIRFFGLARPLLQNPDYLETFREPEEGQVQH